MKLSTVVVSKPFKREVERLAEECNEFGTISDVQRALMFYGLELFRSLDTSKKARAIRLARGLEDIHEARQNYLDAIYDPDHVPSETERTPVGSVDVVAEFDHEAISRAISELQTAVSSTNTDDKTGS